MPPQQRVQSVNQTQIKNEQQVQPNINNNAPPQSKGQTVAHSPNPVQAKTMPGQNQQKQQVQQVQQVQQQPPSQKQQYNQPIIIQKARLQHVTEAEYPEQTVYEPPKPLFITPTVTKTKLYHSKIYQNYIHRITHGARTISDFNNAPIRPETQQEFDALPKKWLDTKKHHQYNEEGILESLDTLRDNMLRSACGLKHALACHFDE